MIKRSILNYIYVSYAFVHNYPTISEIFSFVYDDFSYCYINFLETNNGIKLVYGWDSGFRKFLFKEKTLSTA